MFAIGNEELKDLVSAPENPFKVIHTHKDGTTEVCTVNKCTDNKGAESWAVGGYTTKDGTTYLAVVAGKILKDVIPYKEG